MSQLSEAEIAALGFAHVGRNVRLSSRAAFYNPGAIHLGDNVRIDDFCVLSAGAGGIRLGRNIHIAVYCSLMGQAQIVLEDFAGLSSRVAIYSSSDDYSGAAMTNPTVPERFANVDSRPVRLGRHVIVGTGSVVLPGVTIAEGCAIGALSLVRRDCAPFTIHSGSPARQVGTRKQDLLALEQDYLASAP